jgi:hypothetical protein
MHEPPRYLRAVADHLLVAEPDLWAWFSGDDLQAAERDSLGIELLRSAVRLEPTGPNAARYALADRAIATLGVAAPVTLYQSLDREGAPNAALVDLADAVHIVFQGRILELLTDETELLDLIGHEVSHHKLRTIEAGRFRTMDRLLRWVGQQESAPGPFAETWRRTALFTEIYCDVGGLLACGNRDATLRSLVRTAADTTEADAAAILAQARDLVALGVGETRGLTHPELHVRVLAIAAADQGADAVEAAVAPAVLGPLELGGLDLLDQAHLSRTTRTLLRRAVTDPALASEAASAHARSFFPDLLADTGPAPVTPARPLGASAVDYLCYVLLDVAVAERGKGAMKAATVIADETGIGARFRDIVRQELRGERDLIAAMPRRAA